MHILSRSEEIILFAVLKLKDNAYGVTIRQCVIETTGYQWTVGAVYAPLHRLIKKGYLSPRKGAPAPERGGRSKVFYTITPEGKKAFLQIKKVSERIWSHVTNQELKES